MSISHERFLKLKQQLYEILSMHAVLALLQWDEEVYMPTKGAEARAQHLKTVSKIVHQLETAPSLGDELTYFYEQRNELEFDEKRMIEEALYDYQRSIKIPEVWVGKFSEARSKAYHDWVEAREKSDFSIFSSSLENIITLCRERAGFLGYEHSPYNALLEDYERGIDTIMLDDLFPMLEKEQSRIYQTILQQQGKVKSIFEGKTWDTQKQWDITLRLLFAIGFDFNSGRQDQSIHPFTTNFDMYDVRITTRLNPNNLFSPIFSSLHEGGHALYEQGFREQDRGTWLAQAPSLGIHESQSRFWENIVGRSYSFCSFLLPILKEHFHSELKKIDAEKIYKEVNRVLPNCIRIEADECSYNLHIILRYKMEKDLIEDKISVSDIPHCWNTLFNSLFGFIPPDEVHGCLQDIHWAHGSFGYFPSYALGNLFGAQIAEKMKSELDMSELVAYGNFHPIHTWLKKNIFEVGRRLSAREIVEKTSGSKISHQPFINYLKNKYSDIYNVKL